MRASEYQDCPPRPGKQPAQTQKSVLLCFRVSVFVRGLEPVLGRHRPQPEEGRFAAGDVQTAGTSEPLSQRGTRGTLPGMGHRDDAYLAVDDWDDSLSREDRIERGPFQSFFGIGRADRAAAAVAAARQRALTAGGVFAEVKEQAVYALLADGLSVRSIAERTGIPKTEVGRISRRLGHSGTGPGTGTMPLTGSGQRAAARDQIRQAWGESG